MQAATATYVDRRPVMYRQFKLGVLSVIAVTLVCVPLDALLPAEPRRA